MKHFLELSSLSTDEVRALFELIEHLKREWRAGGNRPVMAGKVLGMVFQKPSLRTRVSFEVAMLQLGGSALMLGPQEIGLGKRESVPDVARVLSSYVDGIMARVFDHRHVTELAQYSRVPVINGLSDDFHPTQAMADLLTIKERLGTLEGLSVAYVGDGNNVAASLMVACAHMGVHYRVATPEGYEVPAGVRKSAEQIARYTGSKFTYDSRPEPIVDGADVVYTDTWISMGQEDEADERRGIFGGYQVNDALLQRAASHAIVLHCLPAHRGEEITDAVMDGPQSAVFQQAENRLHAHKGILAQYMLSR